MLGPLCLTLPLLIGAAQEEVPAGWKAFTSRDGGYSVVMPSGPMEKKQTVKTATGQLQVILQVAEGRSDSVFVVSYSDLPEADVKKTRIVQRLDHARDGAVSSARGKLRSETPIKLDGHPGRDLVIEKDGEAVARMRIYLVGRRLYQVMVLGGGPVVASKDAAIFLDSFRLLK